MTINTESLQPDNSHLKRDSQTLSMSTCSWDDIDGKKGRAMINLDKTPSVDMRSMLPQLRKVGVEVPPDSHLEFDKGMKIDCSFEDIFTLETFHSLILNSYRREKAFIMARVMTIDPNIDQGTKTVKCFWSDYQAHHLNKILYRTQIEANLLHRMRCRNPLNNMVIVGKVYYYAITKEKVADAHRKWEKKTGQQLILDSKPVYESGNNKYNASRVSMALSDCSLLQIDLGPSHRKSYSETALEQPVKVSFREEKVNDQPQLQSNDPHLLANPTEQATGESSDCLIYEAEFIGTDDDFMGKNEFRNYFEIHAIHEDDAKLFPLFPENVAVHIPNLPPSARPNDATQIENPGARRRRPKRTFKNLWGALTWPPQDSLFLKKCGVVDWRCFLALSVTVLPAAVILFILFLPGISPAIAIPAFVLLWVLFFLFFVSLS
jgi:hypothetical protein